VIRVGIVGGTGYTGVELLRLLANHPQVDVKAITSRSEAGVRVADMFPNLRGHFSLAFSEPNIKTLGECDVVFFATPNAVAMTMTRELLKAGVKVIDLSADFRLKDVSVWNQWYGKEHKQDHACSDLLAEAVYGLPEVNREQIKTQQRCNWAFYRLSNISWWIHST
jgi:N-acetyl-gamma-glutamyl-phosphate reductase